MATATAATTLPSGYSALHYTLLFPSRDFLPVYMLELEYSHILKFVNTLEIHLAVHNWGMFETNLWNFR